MWGMRNTVFQYVIASKVPGSSTYRLKWTCFKMFLLEQLSCFAPKITIENAYVFEIVYYDIIWNSYERCQIVGSFVQESMKSMLVSNTKSGTVWLLYNFHSSIPYLQSTLRAVIKNLEYVINITPSQSSFGTMGCSNVFGNSSMFTNCVTD